MSAEFIAFASASSEAVWLRNLMFEIPLLPKPISPVAIHADCIRLKIGLIVKCIMVSLVILLSGTAYCKDLSLMGS